MKALLLILIFPATLAALTQEEARWVKGIQAKAIEERAIKDKAIVRAESAETSLVTAKAILSAQAQAIQKASDAASRVEKEREDWRRWGEAEHDKFLNAETRVEKARKRVWQLTFVSSGLGLGCLVLGYLLLKP